MEAPFHQRLDPLLAGRPAEGGKERLPLGSDVRIRWQTCDVDQTLGFGNRLLVEGSDPHRQRIDETVELGVRKGAIDITVELGELGIDVVCGQQHFKRPAAADQARQSRHRPPPGTRPAPTSHCERTALSRLANRMSLASASSLPTPVALPRIEAMETTGARLRRASISGSAWRPVRPGGMRVESSSGARKS